MSDLSTLHAPPGFGPNRLRSGLDALVLSVVALALAFAAYAIRPATHATMTIGTVLKQDARR